MTNLRTINNHDIESVNEMARRHGGRHNNNNDQKDDHLAAVPFSI